MVGRSSDNTEASLASRLYICIEVRNNCGKDDIREPCALFKNISKFLMFFLLALIVFKSIADVSRTVGGNYKS